jgi:AraC-like DNA-binding protein
MTTVQLLSTDHVAPRRRRDWLCEVIGREYARVDIACHSSDRLFNEMTIYSGQDVRLSSIRSGPIVIEKLRRPSLPDRHDVYLAAMLLTGDYFLEQDGKQISLRPGEMTIYDATRPHRIVCPGDFSKLIVAFPRAMLQERFPGVEKCCARRVGTETGIGSLTTGNIRSFSAEAGALAPEAFDAVSEHCADLVALALADLSGETSAANPGRAATLRRVKRFVESRLHNPELDTAMVSQGVGLSARYVNALFEKEGASLMRHVWGRRLDNCRRDLTSASCAGEPIGQIAFRWGFNDLSHFSRAFKNRFGCSPRELRALAE